MVLFFYGADEYRSRQHMKKTVAAFKQKRDPNGYNTHVFDATKDEPADILNALMTGGFFVEKKMIVIENFLKSKNDVLHDAITAQIKENKIGEDTALLLWEGDGAWKGKLFELLKAQQFVQEFPALTRPQCVGWVMEEATRAGVTMNSLAATKLVEGFEENVASLSQAVAQLAAYTKGLGRTDVAPDDVAYFVPATYDDNTFHFVDALGAHQLRDAVGLLQDQWSLGKSPLELIGALLWKWRGLVAVRAYLDEHKDARAGDIAKALKLHPFVAEKSLRAVRATPLAELNARYSELAAIDLAAKTGGNATALLELFTVKNAQ